MHLESVTPPSVYILGRIVMVFLTISLSIGCSNSYAGKLDDFEKDATTKSKDSRHHCSGDDDSFLFDLLGDILGSLVSAGDSGDEVETSSSAYHDFDIESSERGEPFKPLARADVTFQNVESDVEAFDLRAELGIGPFALHVNQTEFDEKQPADELRLIRIYGLYRMTLTSFCELDLGVGALTIEGNNENSGLSCTMPLLIYPFKYGGLEFRPSWSNINGNSISDYDLALMLGRKYISLKAGYRWLLTDDESLSGPYTGISLHF